MTTRVMALGFFSLFLAVTMDQGTPPRATDAVAFRAPTVLDSLLGPWEGQGTLLGRPAAFSMRWTAGEVPGVYGVLFRNAFRAEDGGETPVLTAQAVYRVADDGSVDGVWFDSRGVRIELSGEADGSRLRIVWRAPTESGTTTYSWLGPGRVEVVDSVLGAQGMREFGRAVYGRGSGDRSGGSSPP